LGYFLYGQDYVLILDSVSQTHLVTLLFYSEEEGSQEETNVHLQNNFKMIALYVAANNNRIIITLHHALTSHPFLLLEATAQIRMTRLGELLDDFFPLGDFV
jgi:hypothetical protein